MLVGFGSGKEQDDDSGGGGCGWPGESDLRRELRVHGGC